MTFILTNELLIRLLLFILIFTITFNILLKIFKQKMVASIIGLAVALLTSYYASYTQLETIQQTYGGGGIIILSLIPSLIAFFFIYSTKITGVLRKIFWIFYGTMMILILQESQNQKLKNVLITIIVITLIIILPLDNWIKNKFNFHKAMKKY